MTEKIVVASDGGTASLAAMDWVVERARWRPLHVEIVTVEELEWLPVGSDEATYRSKYRDVLESAEQHFTHRHGVERVTTSLLTGDPAEAIIDAALGADLLIVGAPVPTRGRLALRVASRATGRMVVVPSGWQPQSGPVVVGFAEDGSADEALERAADEAIRTTAPLVVVHAWDVPMPFTVLDAMIKSTYPALEQLHRQILSEAVARVVATHPTLKVESVLRFGKPSEVIAAAARDASLFVLGGHRRGRIGRIVIGSVAHEVLLAGTTPTMIVSPEGGD